MKRRLFQTLGTSLLVLLLGLTLAACDSQSPAGDASDADAQEAAALTSGLSQDLSLSASQQQAVQNAVDRNRHRMHEPGFLWALAAELHATLTDEQKQRLFDLAAQRDERFGERGCAGPGGFGPGFGRPGHGGPGHGGPGGDQAGPFDDLLTDEQKAAIEEIRARYRPQIEALFTAFRNGEIEQDAFREQMQVLREAMKAEIDALLTDEQKAAIEQRRTERQAEREAEREARRAQERAAMIEALGLSDGQVAALDALLEAQMAERDALFEQFLAETITCEALQTALAALKEAGDAALQDILDETQWEIKRIHDALAGRMRSPGGQRGPGGGGPGHRGPGAGGTGG